VRVGTAPYATPPTCASAGSLVLPPGQGYTWTGDTSNTPGDHTVTAVALPDFKLTGQTEWTIHVKTAGEGLDCRGIVTPTAPGVQQSVCTGPGESSDAVITPVALEGVTYEVDDVTGLVTATADADHKFAAELPEGWTRVSDTVATYQVDLTDPGECLLGAEIIVPQFQDPDCKTDAAVVDAEDTEFMDFTVTGDVEPGGAVTVTAVPMPGYFFPEGFVAEWSHTFDEVTGCVLGSESSRPKPDKKPTVLGTEAVAPTAVDAGLPGSPAASSPTSLLAQLMVAGGLLLLLAGGWLGFGRREYGVHQA
jgi:hypothetical protein